MLIFGIEVWNFFIISPLILEVVWNVTGNFLKGFESIQMPLNSLLRDKK